MRNNQPIINTEVTFSSSLKRTFVQGENSNIIKCNDDLVSISGFSKDELNGQPHNIVHNSVIVNTYVVNEIKYQATNFFYLTDTRVKSSIELSDESHGFVVRNKR